MRKAWSGGLFLRAVPGGSAARCVASRTEMSYNVIKEPTTAAPSPARQRAAGNGVPAAQPRAKRVIDENSIPVPVRPAARPAAAVQRAAETQRTAAPQRAAEPVRRAAAAPSAAVSRADLAAQNEATVRTVARPAASARPAAPKAPPAPAPVRETPKAAPVPAKEAPKAAPPEEFDLDSILAEFK